MDLKFDERGNLKPYGKNNQNLNEFKDMFVENFTTESTRHAIYSNLEKYISEFKTEITSNFKLWINGSYVTDKMNPGDVDIVILVDREIAVKKEDLLQSKYLNKASLKEFNIDAYIVRTYPEDHKKYGITLSDLLYWEHWFSNSKKNRAKKRYPKGYIELVFNHK